MGSLLATFGVSKLAKLGGRLAPGVGGTGSRGLRAAGAGGVAALGTPCGAFGPEPLHTGPVPTSVSVGDSALSRGPAAG